MKKEFYNLKYGKCKLLNEKKELKIFETKVSSWEEDTKKATEDIATANNKNKALGSYFFEFLKQKQIYYLVEKYCFFCK